jgi:pimeloyl-ACP methyl ester carboxylesterase
LKASRSFGRHVSKIESFKALDSTDFTMSSPTSKLPPGTLQMGSGEPLLLFHGVLGTPLMWCHVLPLLAAQYRVIALPALGHQGGYACTERPARIQHVVDDAERALDAMGLAQAHMAGNSLGGWVALELSRRGRARSVCAFSPAGMWDTRNARESSFKLQAMLTTTRLTRPLLPRFAGLSLFRRIALRDSAVHGERTSAAELIALADAALGCSVAQDLLTTPEQFADLKVSCATDIAWSARDRIFPLEPFSNTARKRIPGARHLVLEDVGHVPMLDNPRLVADTILHTTARADELT